MGFEDEVEQSFGRPCRQCDGRSKQTYDLTSSIVPRGTSFHRWVELDFPPIAFDPAQISSCCDFPGPSELLGGLAVSVTAGPSRRTISHHPSSREGHHSTAAWNSIFLLVYFSLHRSQAPATSPLHRNSVPATHAPARVTATRRAAATIGFCT